MASFSSAWTSTAAKSFAGLTGGGVCSLAGSGEGIIARKASKVADTQVGSTRTDRTRAHVEDARFGGIFGKDFILVIEENFIRIGGRGS